MFSIRRGIATTALLTLTLASGCGAPKKTFDPQLPYPPSRAPVVGDILHLPTGIFVDEGDMLRAVTDARIVYVGETHDNPASHRLQLDILRAMHERHPGGVALGMEMFQPGQQEVLDAWVAGELTEKEFLKRSRWHEQWKMDFAYYRDLLVFARHNAIPVIGLNAPKDLVRAVGRQRPQELAADVRQKLPPMDFSDPYQRALVEAIFGGHEQGDGRLAGFLRVQTLWDEAMAENAVRYLESPQGEDKRMVVLAGGNHVRHGFGIPRRVFRRLPTSYVLVGSKEIEIPDDEKKEQRLMDVEIPDFPMPAYDYMAFTAYEELERERVRLGVLLEEKDGQVAIKGVLPGSVADRAGVEKGDRVLSFDDEPVRENFDLIYAVGQKSRGDRAKLVIERDGAKLTFEVSFAEEGEKTE